MTQAIFLSYASQDTDAARRICDALRATGLEVWFDQSELRGGDAWDAAIRKQIKECALFVPIISANTDARPEGYFRLEWKLAVDRMHHMADNLQFLFPLVIDQTPDAAANVPDKFRERQWTRLHEAGSVEVLAAFAGRIAKVLAGRHSPGNSGSNALPDGEFGAPAAKPIRSAQNTRRSLTLGILTFAATGVALNWWKPWRAMSSDAAPQHPELAQAIALIDRLGATSADANVAEDLVKSVLAKQPADGDAMIAMCRVHGYVLLRGFDLSETRFASAKEFADRALVLAPESAEAKACMANFLAQRRVDLPRALKLIEGAITQAPEVARYHRLRNSILSQSTENIDAASLQRSVATAERFPNDALSQYDVGLGASRAGHFDEAERFFHRAIDRGPVPNAITALAAIMLWSRGDLVATRALFDRLPEKHRTGERAVIACFWYALLGGDIEVGMSALRAIPAPWIKDIVYTGPTALLIAELYLRDGKTELAKRRFEDAFAEWSKRKEETVGSQSLFWLESYLLIRLGRMAEARASAAAFFPEMHRPYRLPHLGSWVFSPIPFNLMLGERDKALMLMREAADPPMAKQVMLTSLRLDPRMAPFRNDAAIARILAE